MDLNLQVKPRGEDALVASYTCPCGCNPRLAYHRGEEHATDGCCCGNEFAVGTRAADHLHPGEGFTRELQLFDAPWGERVQAVWTIGQSVDDSHDHDHDHGGEAAAPATTATDPVCGMTVDIEAARAKGLHSAYKGTDYVFCGKGCKLEFDEDPERYLDPSYVPSM